MKWCTALLACLLLAACGKTQEPEYEPTVGIARSEPLPQYVVGIHPLHNPQRLMSIYGPILEHVNQRLPKIQLTLEASRNYEEFEKKLYAGAFAFAMPNPYQTVQAVQHGYRVFGKMGDDEDFRGVILVRKDGGIRQVTDLKGRAVSYPAPTALAATLLPQHYLHTHGLNINRDVENRYVGSQESSIMSVYRNQVSAAATWPVPWKAFQIEHPQTAAQLEVKWETATLPNNGWVVRADVPADVADRFAQSLFELHATPTGKALLQRVPVTRFEPATEDTYRPVREFVDMFAKTVRPLEPSR